LNCGLTGQFKERENVSVEQISIVSLWEEVYHKTPIIKTITHIDELRVLFVVRLEKNQTTWTNLNELSSPKKRLFNLSLCARVAPRVPSHRVKTTGRCRRQQRSWRIASALAPPRIKFLILWAAANGVHRNSLAKSVIFSDIFFACLSTALKNWSDEKR